MVEDKKQQQNNNSSVLSVTLTRVIQLQLWLLYVIQKEAHFQCCYSEVDYQLIVPITW